MGTGPAWPAARGPPLFRSGTPRADAGRDGFPGRDHPRAGQVPEFILRAARRGTGLRSFIDELLAKLRSVDAIGEEEYRRERSARPSSLPAPGRLDDWWRLETAGRYRQMPLLDPFFWSILKRTEVNTTARAASPSSRCRPATMTKRFDGYIAMPPLRPRSHPMQTLL